MGQKKKNIKGRWNRYLFVVLWLLLGAVLGIIISSFAKHVDGRGESTADFIFYELLGLAGLFFAVYFQMIVHEAGHLLFGLISGYHFSSFRIGSFMLLKQNGKICTCRMSLAGTGGQCLMAPPDLEDGKIPYILYNLGGVIVNLILVGICVIPLILEQCSGIAALFLLEMVVTGLFFAATNGIPLHVEPIDNDGYNALSLGKSPEAMRAFWIQMKMNEQIANGIRLKDMPDEWFQIPSQEAMKNSMEAAVGVFSCNRLMDKMEFEKASQIMKQLMELDSGMIGLHRSLLMLDLIYCELVGENRPEQLEAMLDKPLKKFMKSMKNFPSILRVQYTYALLAEKDAEKTVQIKAKFEKTARSYPYPSEIQGERELMEYAECQMLLKFHSHT